MTTEYKRMQQLRGSAADWVTDNIIPLDGELAVERSAGIDARIKMGDGARSWSALPYLIPTPATRALGSINAVTTAPPVGAVAGDFWINNGTGNVLAAWGAPAAGLATAPGDQLLRSTAGTWSLIPIGSNLAPYAKIADLAAPGGSATIGFLQAGTGAVARTAQAKMRDLISLKDFGAVDDGTVDDTAAAQAAINALPAAGGVITLPGPGDYDLTLGSLTFAAKRVRWEMPHSATINGAAFAEIPGEWVRPSETVWFVAGGDAAAFQIGFNHRTLLQSGALGNFEAAHFECDARAYGTAGKFIVGLTSIGNTSSNGNIFGINAFGVSQAGAATSTEVSGAEINTAVLGASVNRKTGLQIVDTSNSVGAGIVHDAAIWIAKQGAPALGYKNGVQIGGGDDASFPIYGNAALIHASIGTLGGRTIGYGFRAGMVSYSNAALQLQANAPGHVLGWAAGSGSGLGAGMVASICTVDNGGAVIFNAGGIVFQSNTIPGGARFTGLELVSDATNPVKIVAGGLSRNVQVGATDSGGSGFRMLRVAN